MASGVKVSDKVKDIYNEMKVVKTDDNPKERIRIVVMAIEGGYIDIEHIFREKDLEGKDVYLYFLSLLKPDQCRYLMYDSHFTTTEQGSKEELVFVMWAPETSAIKLKMQYAASKEAMRKALGGIKHEMQINDLADVNSRDHFAQMLGKKITSLEGVAVSGSQ